MCFFFLGIIESNISEKPVASAAQLILRKKSKKRADRLTSCINVEEVKNAFGKTKVTNIESPIAERGK